MTEKEKLEILKKFWSDKNDPHHHHRSEDWFDKYYREFYFHTGGYDSITDVGCGSGEFLIRFASDFKKVTGLDMSESMVEEAKKKVNQSGATNISVHCGAALDIDKVLTEKTDVIFSNGVVQYLTPPQFKTFVTKCMPLLNENGIIMMMNIPNFNLEVLYYLGIFKNTDNKITAKELQKKIRKFNFMIWKQKLRNPGYEYEPGLGFWHSIPDVKTFAAELGLEAEFYNSIYFPYGYRFHVRFSRKAMAV